MHAANLPFSWSPDDDDTDDTSPSSSSSSSSSCYSGNTLNLLHELSSFPQIYAVDLLVISSGVNCDVNNAYLDVDHDDDDDDDDNDKG